MEEILKAKTDLIHRIAAEELAFNAIDPTKLVLGLSLLAEPTGGDALTISLSVDLAGVVRDIMFPEFLVAPVNPAPSAGRSLSPRLLSELSPSSFFEAEASFWSSFRPVNLFLDRTPHVPVEKPLRQPSDALRNIDLSSLDVSGEKLVDLLREAITAQLKGDFDLGALFHVAGSSALGEPDSLTWAEWLEEPVMLGPTDEADE